MQFVSPRNSQFSTELGRPIVVALFLASCLLAIVSYYTTQQGMALYLSPWFSVLAALGIQLALVMVAWLIGFTRKNRALLVMVYAVTALVSIAFSYVSLYTWFTARERPTETRRALYDELSSLTSRSEELFTRAQGTGERYAVALEEMAAAERSVGRISRAQDADPYLNRIREAVAREAQSYASSYREGAGEGVRYTAFDRYAKLTRESVAEISAARRSLAALRASTNPDMPSAEQLRRFHAVYDALPWSTAGQLLQDRGVEKPAVPDYSRFVDRTSGGQEDLLRSFSELITAPSPRNMLAFMLAAFIDIVVFLLAYASGPFFFGEPEQRWCAASAALDSIDRQVFVRSLLRKVEHGPGGSPRVADSILSAGERQLCLLMINKKLAAAQDDNGRRFYLLDPQFHEGLLESLAAPGLPLHAASRGASASA